MSRDNSGHIHVWGPLQFRAGITLSGAFVRRPGVPL